MFVRFVSVFLGRVQTLQKMFNSLYISQLIFFTSLSQVGAKSFPSLIWLEESEQEGYSSDTVLRF